MESLNGSAVEENCSCLYQVVGVKDIDSCDTGAVGRVVQGLKRDTKCVIA